LASAAFDGEGVATQARDLVAGGILQGYVLSSYSARRLGLATTGNAGGVHNLVVAPNAGRLEEIIASCDTALVVTELLGQGVNIVTGDYSRGAAGFWVEKGKIVCPVSEVTIAGNLREMFTRIEAVGSDVDLRGAVRCGSVLVGGLTIAGR
jgi:PmbA protein